MAEIITPGVLQHDELADLGEIVRRVEDHRLYNQGRAQYYEAHARVNDLNISTPPQMRNLGTVVGWPGTVVDALEERLDITGFTAPNIDLDSLGVQDIWDRNELFREYPGAHTDSLIHGVTFLATSRGGQGEPDPLITVESPLSMSAVFDPRGRRVVVAGSITRDEDDHPVAASLYRPNVTTHVELNPQGKWVVTHRDFHNLGRVTVRRLVNNPRASRQWGRSEITRDVLYYTKAAIRTLLGAEVSREFYSAPQRWIMGAKEEAFETADGAKASAWQTYMGRFIALSKDEDDDGDGPRVGQFDPASPTPYIELLRMLSIMVASSAAIPPTYFGFVTENPPSADAIRAFEARHVKRAARRCSSFGPEWAGAIKDAILLRDGHVPAELHGLRTKWADPATPTHTATADATAKLVSAFPWMAQSDVLLERLGFDPTDLQRLKTTRNADKQQTMLHALAGTESTLTALTEAGARGGEGAVGSEVTKREMSDVKVRADALGSLIRAGVEPQSAAAQVGLTGVEFPGAVPVSLRVPKADTGELEEK